MKAECSLFVPKEEWERIEKEKEAKRLVLLRAEEAAAASQLEVTRARRELAEAESCERQFARRDLALLKAQDQAQKGESSSTVAGPHVFDPWADPGWLQANDPSFGLLPDQLFVDFLAGNPMDPVEPLYWPQGFDTAPSTGGSS